MIITNIRDVKLDEEDTLESVIKQFFYDYKNNRTNNLFFYNFIEELKKIYVLLDNPYCDQELLEKLQELPKYFSYFNSDQIDELKSLQKMVRNKAHRLLKKQNRKFRNLDEEEKVEEIDKMNDIYKKEKQLENREREIKNIKYEMFQTLEKLSQLSSKLEEYGEKPIQIYHSIKVSKEDLLEVINDHFEIKKEYLEYLKFIDLSEAGIFESKLKASGIDFRGTNIILNPQRVYNKDLSNSKFGDNNLYGSFDGVDLRGCDISKEINGFGFENAIIDEYTKLPNEYDRISRL